MCDKGLAVREDCVFVEIQMQDRGPWLFGGTVREVCVSFNWK